MPEVEIDLEKGETVEVVTKTTEVRTRWILLDIQISPEQRNITVRFYGAVKGKVVHKSRCLSIEQDPETMEETGFWLDNEAKINVFVEQILQAFGIEQVE